MINSEFLNINLLRIKISESLAEGGPNKINSKNLYPLQALE